MKQFSQFTAILSFGYCFETLITSIWEFSMSYSKIDVSAGPFPDFGFGVYVFIVDD
jgi:hypothetical protein